VLELALVSQFTEPSATTGPQYEWLQKWAAATPWYRRRGWLWSVVRAAPIRDAHTPDETPHVADVDEDIVSLLTDPRLTTRKGWLVTSGISGYVCHFLPVCCALDTCPSNVPAV
jgi:hypothetical protein